MSEADKWVEIKMAETEAVEGRVITVEAPQKFSLLGHGIRVPVTREQLIRRRWPKGIPLSDEQIKKITEIADSQPKNTIPFAVVPKNIAMELPKGLEDPYCLQRHVMDTKPVLGVSVIYGIRLDGKANGESQHPLCFTDLLALWSVIRLLRRTQLVALGSQFMKFPLLSTGTPSLLSFGDGKGVVCSYTGISSEGITIRTPTYHECWYPTIY